MIAPSFMVIGAPKGGTTWLHANLSQHDNVFTGIRKEVNFFNHNYDKGIGWYQRQYTGYSGERAIGDFSPGYFWPTEVPRLIRKHYPDTRLIVTLRDPVDRTISAFYHNIRARRVSPSTRILDLKPDHPTFTIGFYDLHLERWFETFPRSQFLILFYEEDIVRKKEETLEAVFKFIDVDYWFKPRRLEAKQNSRYSHLAMRVNYYAPVLAKVAERVLPSTFMNSDRWKIPVENYEIEELGELFRKHNERLSKLLGRDLPWQRRTTEIETAHDYVR
jgi:hypothetical protein